MLAQRLIAIAIGYAFGLFQTGYFYGKARHDDIRNHGSGNAGTTNTLRTFGIKAGIIVFAGDLFKAMIAIWVIWMMYHNQYPDSVRLLMEYAGLGAVLGHNFPFYLGFKGGKGIACTSGFILAFYLPIAPICLALFIAAVVITRYVSLGSLLVVTSFLIQLFVFGHLGMIPVANYYLPEVYIVGIAFTALAFWMHRANIKRLLQGTESKIQFTKAGKEE